MSEAPEKDLFHEEMLRITEQTELTRDFSIRELDSLSRTEIIVQAESFFNITITNEEIKKLITYGDLQDLIKAKNA